MDIIAYYLAFIAILLTGFIGTLSFLEGIMAAVRNKIGKKNVPGGSKIGKILSGIVAVLLAVFLYQMLTLGSMSSWFALGICLLFVITDHIIGRSIKPKEPS
ncbi:MAG: hypothetical protein R2681_17990 [Pyrinomonadaceae bacterium]